MDERWDVIDFSFAGIVQNDDMDGSNGYGNDSMGSLKGND